MKHCESVPQADNLEFESCGSKYQITLFGVES